MLLVIAAAVFGVLVMAACAWRYADEANRLEAERDAARAALIIARRELAKPHPSTQAQHRARAANAERVKLELAGIAR